MSICLCGRPFAAGEERCPRCGRPVLASAPVLRAPGGEERLAPATPATGDPPAAAAGAALASRPAATAVVARSPAPAAWSRAAREPVPGLRSRRRAGLAAAAGLLVLGVGSYLASLHLAGVGGEARSAYLPAPVTVASPTSSTAPMAVVASHALTRVVTVEALTDDGERFGTGWLLDDTADFVTNAHVVQGQHALRLLDRAGRLHVAVLLGSDAGQDIAVLRSTDAVAGQPLPLETGGEGSVPQPVVVLASSRATTHGDVTLESLIARHRTVSVEPGQEGRNGTEPIVYDDMLLLGGQSIYQGNSGGPVLDAFGRVLGIVTAASSTHPEAYAIPVGRVITELRTFAARGGPAG